MAARKTFTVNSEPGLNVREFPSRSARIVRVLRDGEKVTIVADAAAPDGWTALRGGGYVVSEYLK